MTVTGFQFTNGVTNFYFGGMAGTNVVCTSATTCTATTPQTRFRGATGKASVRTFTAGVGWGPVNPNVLFNYTAALYPACPPVCPPPPPPHFP